MQTRRSVLVSKAPGDASGRNAESLPVESGQPHRQGGAFWPHRDKYVPGSVAVANAFIVRRVTIKYLCAHTLSGHVADAG